MIPRGPFQPLPFCDSVILGQETFPLLIPAAVLALYRRHSSLLLAIGNSHNIKAHKNKSALETEELNILS